MKVYKIAVYRRKKIIRREVWERERKLEQARAALQTLMKAWDVVANAFKELGIWACNIIENCFCKFPPFKPYLNCPNTPKEPNKTMEDYQNPYLRPTFTFINPMGRSLNEWGGTGN